MDLNYPIHTAQVECQDCYKCVRDCPVKAIKVFDGHASIISSECTSCGHCVVVCPVNAKKIRNDISRAELLLGQNKKVYASLAPSWITEFEGVRKSQMIAAIMQLGFAGVSETALGAQEVTAGLRTILNNTDKGLFISSACPSVVDFISKHMPDYKTNICNLLSPVLAHTAVLRKEFGDDIGVIFFGPCIAKKLESDRFPEKLNIALSFQDLKLMFEKNGIDLASVNQQNESFVPFEAAEGSLYPIDGGMIKTMGIDQYNPDLETVAISGLDHLKYYLEGFDNHQNTHKIFVEALACKGGCINGPCRSDRSAGLKDRFLVKDSYHNIDIPLRRNTVTVNESMRLTRTKRAAQFSNEKIKKALAKIGKINLSDELNCGGCGYDTCRHFAAALLEGKAEPAMCVSLMRKKALNKANAILRCMPSAAVIVDSSLRIIECNEHFAGMFGDDTLMLYAVLPSLKGAFLDKIVPFAHLFKLALRTGEDMSVRNLRVGDKLLHLTLFTIEAQQIIGAIIQDATETEMKREEIAKKANDVLKKNLHTVQEVAKLLGEHMADTEILLRSIAKGFSVPEPNAQDIPAKKGTSSD